MYRILILKIKKIERLLWQQYDELIKGLNVGVRETSDDTTLVKKEK